VDVLQEESTAVGLKIATLDSIMQSSNPAGFLSVRTNKEPSALTLLDLSRHTDKELAYKAQQLLRIAQFDAKMINDLGSKDEQTEQAAEEALFRMEKSRAQRILDRAPIPEAQKKRLDNEVENGARTRLPIPTGTSQGDRYYIQAEWNTASAVQCVYRLFAQEDFSFARQEQSSATKGKPETKSIISNVYDSKAKALGAYDEILRCHARPKFVAGF
jgi:hypothetical protein